MINSSRKSLARQVTLAAVCTVALCCGLPYLALQRLFAIERVEIFRVANSELQLDAAVVRSNGGATTSFGFEVWIVPSRRAWNKGEHVFTGDRIYPMDPLLLAWRKSRLSLSIPHGARVFRQFEATTVSGREVSVQIDRRATPSKELQEHSRESGETWRATEGGG